MDCPEELAAMALLSEVLLTPPSFSVHRSITEEHGTVAPWLVLARAQVD